MEENSQPKLEIQLKRHRGLKEKINIFSEKQRMRSLPPVTAIDKKYERICVMKKKLTTEEKSSVQEAIAGQKKKKKR